MKKRILVTGANGQLGKTIKELYLKKENQFEFTFTTKIEFNITNQDSLNQFFNNNMFDYCINCAAYTNVEQAEKSPEIAYKVNAEGVKYLAEACKKSNTILIHISTDYVFDGEKQTSYTIKDKPNPINEYGKSKLLGEQHIQNILKEYFIIRTSWLYSKIYGKNFYKTILKKAETETKLFITDEQKGCPTNTVNLAKFSINLINTNRPFGIYHFSDNKAMSWYDFAIQILKEKKLSNKVNVVKSDKYVTFAKRPKHTIL